MRRHLLLIALVLLLALPLTLAFRDLVRDVILVQALRALWTARLFFESLPQVPLWALFLLVALLIALRSLTRGKRLFEGESELVFRRPAQVQALANRIQNAEEGEYSKWRLRRYLGELIFEVLAYRERTTRDEMRYRWRTGELDAPPEIQAFLQTGPAPTFSRAAGLLTMLRQRLRLRAQTFPAEWDVERVIQYLEDQLDVQRDRHHHPTVRSS